MYVCMCTSTKIPHRPSASHLPVSCSSVASRVAKSSCHPSCRRQSVSQSVSLPGPRYSLSESEESACHGFCLTVSPFCVDPLHFLRAVCYKALVALFKRCPRLSELNCWLPSGVVSSDDVPPSSHVSAVFVQVKKKLAWLRGGSTLFLPSLLWDVHVPLVHVKSHATQKCKRAICEKKHEESSSVIV